MSEVLKNEHRNIDLTNLRVLELGIGIPFSGNSTTDYIKYKKKNTSGVSNDSGDA